MTPLTRLAAIVAVAAMTLGAGTAARAANFLPAGANLTAPASQFTFGTGTNQFSVTTVLEDDPNGFLDLTSGEGVPFNPSTFDPVGVTGSVASLPGGAGIAYGSSFLQTFTFNLDSPAKTVTVAAKADTGVSFASFGLTIFESTDGVWDVGSVSNGTTFQLGTDTGPGDATGPSVSLTLSDLIPAEYAIVLQTTAPLSGGDLDNGFSQLNYQLSLDLAPIPLPATLWLLISGLVGLAGFGTLRRVQAA